MRVFVCVCVFVCVTKVKMIGMIDRVDDDLSKLGIREWRMVTKGVM